jgi:hypothetical protein
MKKRPRSRRAVEPQTKEKRKKKMIMKKWLMMFM